MASVMRPFKQWARFSLRTLFLAMTALCLALGTEAQRARCQRAAVAAVESRKGFVTYSRTGRIKNSSLRRLVRERIGPEYVERVIGINLFRREFGDAETSTFDTLGSLESLNLFNTDVTDAGLRHLRGLTSITILDLGRTNVTDTGFAQLARFTKLVRQLEIGLP